MISRRSLLACLLALPIAPIAALKAEEPTVDTVYTDSTTRTTTVVFTDGTTERLNCQMHTKLQLRLLRSPRSAARRLLARLDLS